MEERWGNLGQGMLEFSIPGLINVKNRGPGTLLESVRTWALFPRKESSSRIHVSWLMGGESCPGREWASMATDAQWPAWPDSAPVGMSCRMKTETGASSWLVIQWASPRAKDRDPNGRHLRQGSYKKKWSKRGNFKAFLFLALSIPFSFSPISQHPFWKLYFVLPPQRAQDLKYIGNWVNKCTHNVLTNGQMLTQKVLSSSL